MQALTAEVASLKAAAGAPASTGAAMVPPPSFYPPPPYQPTAYPPPYGGAYGHPPQYAAPPGYGAPPATRPPATLPLNAKNERGPKGANLAVFCIPNSYYDQQVLNLVLPYGNVVFCQVLSPRPSPLGPSPP